MNPLLPKIPTRDISKISGTADLMGGVDDSLIKNIAKAMAGNIVEPYKKLWLDGIPKEQIAAKISSHLKAIDDSDADECDKEHAKLELTIFAKEIFKEDTYDHWDYGKMLDEGWVSKHQSLQTHVLQHPKLNLFAGRIHGVDVRPTNETGLHRHLVQVHQYKPQEAASFIDKVKAGTPQGHDSTRLDHHLGIASQHAEMALLAHNKGNDELKANHLHVTNQHLDHADNQMMLLKPEQYNRPQIHHQLHQIHLTVKRMA